jgi:hypothetical protein
MRADRDIGKSFYLNAKQRLCLWIVACLCCCSCLQLLRVKQLLLQQVTRLQLLAVLLACRGACGHCSAHSSWLRSRAED